MRKLTVILIALTLCLQAFSGTVAYGADDPLKDGIEVTGFEPSPSGRTFKEDDMLGIRFTCINKTDKELKDVKISPLSGSDFGINGSYPYPLMSSDQEINIMPIGEQLSDLIPFRYLGTGRDLSVKIEYTYDGSKGSITKEFAGVGFVTPKAAGSSPPPSSPNTSNYVPKLETASGNYIPTIVAGNTQKMTFPVKNNSIYQARNVYVSLKMADETKTPYVLENFDLRQYVDYINGTETNDITFDISILRNAPEGLYAMKLNYDFNNAYNDHFSTSETVYIRVKNDNLNPKLTVDGISVKDSAAASGVIDLDLKVKNLGNLPAKDVKVTLRGLKSGGFTAYNSTDVKYANKIGGGSFATVSYQLLAPASGAAGGNELSVRLDYTDGAGNTYTEENQIFVPVGEGEASKPDILFDKIIAPTAAMQPGNDFDVVLDLKNNGGAARNIKVMLSAEQSIIIKSMNPVYVENLSASSVKQVSFKMFATDEAPTRNYPVSLNLEYEDSSGVKYNTSQYVGIYVENETGKTVPRIIIDNYSMDPFPVNAGEDFNLKMSFLNTSKTVDVSNIKVTVTSDDGTFTPTDSGNTFYVEGISRNQRVERELLLHVKPDAEQKSYMLSVSFEYEDDKGNPFTAKETMSVRVLQNPRLVTGDLNFMPETYVGQPVSIYLDFYNMGKSTLYNLMIKVEGDFQGQGLSYYVGNFEPGRTDFFDASFSAMTPGEQKGNILFSFEDANGKINEIRKEFTLNVMEMPSMEPVLDENGMPMGKDMFPGMDGKMPGGAKKTSILYYVIPAVAVLVVGVVLFIILRKRHIRRKEMSLDE